MGKSAAANLVRPPGGPRRRHRGLLSSVGTPTEPGARENQHPPSRSCRQQLHLEVILQESIMPSSFAGARRVCGLHGKPALLESSTPGPGTLSAPSTAGAPGRRHGHSSLLGASTDSRKWSRRVPPALEPMGTSSCCACGRPHHGAGWRYRGLRCQEVGDRSSPDAALRALVGDTTLLSHPHE